MVDTVGIVGLGLIGGSLARRLTERGVRVIAWNHRSHPYAQAEADGIFCKSTLSELMDAEPDVVVLCNPLKAMPAILAALAPLMGDHPNTTLTDVGSVKGMVRDQVKAAALGKCYVVAHPMAGNELSGWQAADPHLYDGALWAITVDESTDYRRFLDVAAMITKDVGNRVIVVDDETHDKAAAMISHMPHVVSTALINELVANPDRNIAAALAAGEVVKAPMPGVVLKVQVQQGQAVKAGQVLIILEAMKMENEIVAPKDGTVAQIVAAKGATVESGAPLVVLA